MLIDPDPKEPTDEHDNAPGGDEGDEGPGAGADDESDGAEGDGSEDAGESSEADAGLSEDAEDEVEGDAEPTARRKSASDVIRETKKSRKEAERLAAEARREAEEARREAAESRRRVEELERRQTERRTAETEAEERERVALMSEEERLNHYRAKDRAEHKQEMDGVRFQIWDSTDRTEFRQLVREDPLVAKVKDRVDAEFERLKAAGRPVAREILANQFIAKDIREGRTKAGTEQRKRAADGVRRHKVKPPQTRSDVAGGRQRRGEGDTKAARFEKLKDVIL